MKFAPRLWLWTTLHCNMQYWTEKSVRIKSLYKQVLERTNELQVSSDVPTTNISLIDSAHPPLARNRREAADGTYPLR